MKNMSALNAFSVPVKVFLLVFLLGFITSATRAAQVGLFMGSFDPPHFGILRMIEESCSRFSLDTIHVVPVPIPVDRSELAPLEHRLAMLRLLTKDMTKARIPTIEELQNLLARQPSNFFEAIREEIMNQRPPEDEIFQIVGEDALVKLVARNQLPAPGERRRIVVFPRHGVPLTRHPVLDEQIRDGRVMRIDADIPDLASRDLRSQMSERCEPSVDALPESIRAYIRREGLYGMPGTPLSGKILDGFAPVGYMAKPVLLYEAESAPTFTAFHPERLANSIARTEGELASPDFPTALALVLANHPLHVTLFQAGNGESLDWLQKQGWRVLHGYVPVESEYDDRPMLFFGRQGLDWHLFVTGVTDANRFDTLLDTFRGEFNRLEFPPERLTVMYLARP